MPRQRLGLTHTWATTLGQKLMIVPGIALIYGGGVVLALGAGIAPDSLNSAIGYQSVYERLGALDPANWSGGVTIAVAVGGLLGLGLLMALGWAQRLIPHVTRSALVLREEDDGRTTVSPRAIERAVEIAARQEGVRAAKATLGEDEVHVALHARRAELIPDLLLRTKARATAALEQSGVGATNDVRVTVTRFTPATKSELLK